MALTKPVGCACSCCRKIDVIRKASAVLFLSLLSPPVVKGMRAQQARCSAWASFPSILPRQCYIGITIQLRGRLPMSAVVSGYPPFSKGQAQYDRFTSDFQGLRIMIHDTQNEPKRIANPLQPNIPISLFQTFGTHTSEYSFSVEFSVGAFFAPFHSQAPNDDHKVTSSLKDNQII